MAALGYDSVLVMGGTMLVTGYGPPGNRREATLGTTKCMRIVGGEHVEIDSLKGGTHCNAVVSLHDGSVLSCGGRRTENDMTDIIEVYSLQTLSGLSWEN